MLFVHKFMDLMRIGEKHWGDNVSVTTAYQSSLQGLIPLPAPLCWYECCVAAAMGRPMDRKGILVAARSRTCIEVKALVERTPPNVLVSTHTETLDWARVDWKPEISGPFKSIKERKYVAKYIHDTSVATYLTLVLNSRSTRVTTEEPPERLNRARAKRGEEPVGGAPRRDDRATRIYRCWQGCRRPPPVTEIALVAQPHPSLRERQEGLDPALSRWSRRVG